MRRLLRDISVIVAMLIVALAAVVALALDQYRLSRALAAAEARNAAQHQASRLDRAELRAWEQELMRRVGANARRIDALERRADRGEGR